MRPFAISTKNGIDPYYPLYTLSRTIRYMAEPSQWVPFDTIEANVFERHLYLIEKSVLKLLNIETPVKITIQDSPEPNPSA